MKTVSLFDNYGALNSKPVFDAFKVGLEEHGYVVKHNSLDADVAVIWSMLWQGRMSYNRQVFTHFRRLNRDVFVLEVGSISRGNTWRVGLNGIKRDQLIFHPDPEINRPDLMHLNIKPWRTSGNKILICGQNEKSEIWKGMPSMDNWLSNTVNAIREYTDMPIVVRPHPRFPLLNIKTKHPDVSIQRPVHIKTSYDSYDLSFDNLHAMVCWSSTPAAIAGVNGIPIFTGPDSIAYPIANTNLSSISTPAMPDRTNWIIDYARSEYTLLELKQGMPLKTLTKV
jgi:hypothetical protein